MSSSLKLIFEFIHDVLDLDEVVEEAKKRFLSNIIKAQQKGEIRKEIAPELIWLVTEKNAGTY